MAGTTILDIGSHTIKAGISLHFPYESSPDVVVSSSVKEAQGATRRAALRGEVVDWEALDSVLDYVFYDRIGWERGHEGNLLVCEPLCVTRSEREKMSLLLFERFGVEGVFVQDAAVLSLYAVGRLTGCVVDCGHSKIDIAPVYEGLLRTQGIRRLPFGGSAVRNLLQEHMQLTQATASNLKEMCSTLCETEEAFESLLNEEKTFTLPDGSSLSVSDRQCAVLGEVLIRPELMGQQGPGIAESIYNATYHQSDLPSKRQHLENIFLCGGVSLTPNLPSRLFKELQCLLPNSYQPGFCSCPEYMPSNTQKWAAWMGGAILAKVQVSDSIRNACRDSVECNQVVTQHGHLATKSDYDEMGPSVLHKKFHMGF